MSDKENGPANAPPLVTVLVGCFNQARFAVETLESVRQQSYPNIQLIVWDDCSQDNSVEVIQSWIQRHQVECAFLRHAVNRGICQSLNAALQLARGKYIAIVAADDVWLPDRIERHVQLMENSPDEVGLVYTNAFQMDEQGKMYPQMFIEAHRQFLTPPEGFLFDVLWEGNFIPAMTTLIRRACFTQVGTYDEQLCFEDWDMWLRISRHFRFLYDPVPAAKYRIVSTSMVRTKVEAMKRSTCLFKAKCFFRGWLNPAQGGNAILDLEGAIWRLYEIGSPVPWRWIVALLKHHGRSPRPICMVACITAGLNYARFLQVVACCGAIKRTLFRRPR